MFKILEFIGNGAVGAVDLFEAFLAGGYGATPSRINRELAKIEKRRSDFEHEQRAKQNYYTLVSRLKRDGLIQEKTSDGQKSLILTNRGKNKLSLFKKIMPKVILPPPDYSKETDNKFTIIAFDVPEAERRKRDWLRLALNNLGLTMVQKSVWIGKIKIPQDFLEDLHMLKLTSFVEIFEITKAGSLKHLS